MSPPGRRRQIVPTLSLLLGLLCLFAGTASAASNVIGLDFGTKFLKAVLVKPGIPLEIVPTKDSKRKEVAAIAFKPNNIAVDEGDSYPDRLFGSDASNLAARFPGEVFPNLKRVLSKVTLDETFAEEYQRRHPGLNIEEMGWRKLVGFKSHAFSRDEPPFTTEELLAMMFQNIRANAVTLAGGSSVDDAVITIPPFYNSDERRAVLTAADLAGLRVNALTTDGLAVGLHYATTRSFPKIDEGQKPEYHMVFDMGAGSTTATVLRFQSRSVKDVGRFNKTVQEVSVVGAGWNTQVGGDILNSVIIDDMIAEFLASPAAKEVNKDEDSQIEFKENGRAMERLGRDAERIRGVLSANNEAHASFESLYDDIDFKYSLTRKNFQVLAAPWGVQIPDVINDALKAADLTADKLDSVVVHGGTSRTPFVQKILEEMFGADRIRSNVNADEAAVFGAAFKGASLSPSFKVKEIRDQDTVGYPYTIKWFDETDSVAREDIFSPYEKFGVVKEVPMPKNEDFLFSINQKIQIEESVLDLPVTDYETSNVKTQVQALQDKFGCSKNDIQLSLQIRLHPVDGVPEVVNATVGCEIEVTEKKGGVVDNVKGFFGFGDKESQEPLNDESTASSSSSSSSGSSTSTTSSDAPTESAKDEGKLVTKKKVEKLEVNFYVEKNAVNSFRGVDGDPIGDAKKRLAAWDKSDKQRRQREEALNTLEAYIYKVRDQLEDTDFVAAATDAEQTALAKLRETTSEWMSDIGDKASKKELTEKYNELKKLVTPLKKRVDETAQRPELIENIQQALSQTGELLKAVKEGVEKAAESATASSDTASSDTASSETASSDGSSESSSTTSSAIPIPSPSYTKEDLSELEKVYDTVTEWFSSTLAKQEKLKPNEDAALTSTDLKAKARELNDSVMSVLRRQMRRQQEAKSKASKSKSKTKSSSTTKAAKETDAAEVEGESPITLDLNNDGQMPSVEEIEAMIKQKQEEEAQKKSKHDEL